MLIAKLTAPEEGIVAEFSWRAMTRSDKTLSYRLYYFPRLTPQWLAPLVDVPRDQPNARKRSSSQVRQVLV